jgi:hypothetical protein
MTADNARAEHEELQFDRVASDAPTGASASAGAAVTCAICSTPIHTHYYHVNGMPACARCRETAAAQATTPRGWGPLAWAAALGIGAAIVGAGIYYAVIAITDFEIGIVAILIGYMVGYAVRKGAGDRGGRRFQVLAAVLTYWAVGLAYTPLAFKQVGGEASKTPAAAVADSARAPVSDSVSAPSPDTAQALAANDTEQNASHRSLLFSFGVLFVFVFALPVVAIVGSLPSGLLSALIIFIGLRTAWQKTAALPLEVTGPYRVGARSPAAPA